MCRSPKIVSAVLVSCDMSQTSSQVSFRRILLSRLLLLSVPVLLLGVYVTSRVTYRKARSALLETARQNLTESAVRKSNFLDQTIDRLRANLAAASSSYDLVAATAPPDASQLEALQQQLSGSFTCLQLQAPTTELLLANTCGETLPPATEADGSWSDTISKPISPGDVKVEVLLPEPETALGDRAGDDQRDLDSSGLLELVLSAPVYGSDGSLRYRLRARVTLRDRSQIAPGSLSGYPVIIDEAGTILVHPFPERIGRNISEEADALRLDSLLRNALAGNDDFLHLFSFEQNGIELLSGYTSMDSPVFGETDQRWVVLAIARLDDTLADLAGIRRVLLGLLAALIVALIAASTAAIFYISRETARPLEKLRDYALTQDNLYSNTTIPHDFHIREFAQLGRALEQMLGRLRGWTEELERAWQDAKTANQLKDEFLTITSHELRTPLNGIIGSLNIIQDDLCDSRAEELLYLEQAHQSALSLHRIVTDISDITKLQAGQLQVNIEPVDLGDCLQTAIASYRSDLAEKGLALDWQPPPAAIWVYADPQQLQRVFEIVLDNAAKFTAEGSVTVTTEVEASTDSASGQWAIATIRDTGIGVAPELQPKLFKPFAVVDGSFTRSQGGIGLGLAIARNLIDLMHGQIHLHSDGRDCGTSVSIGLPVARKVAPVPSAAEANRSS